ncbi:hypothetical protein [Streptomyces sp. NPDC001068]|uniref:hypothetical protein n=1 Tax=Streptomyces sp. NPDC001068 TaxID=3364544 RepID=UPI0036790AAA
MYMRAGEIAEKPVVTPAEKAIGRVMDIFFGPSTGLRRAGLSGGFDLGVGHGGFPAWSQ